MARGVKVVAPNMWPELTLHGPQRSPSPLGVRASEGGATAGRSLVGALVPPTPAATPPGKVWLFSSFGENLDGLRIHLGANIDPQYCQCRRRRAAIASIE